MKKVSIGGNKTKTQSFVKSTKTANLQHRHSWGRWAHRKTTWRACQGVQTITQENHEQVHPCDCANTREMENGSQKQNGNTQGWQGCWSHKNSHLLSVGMQNGTGVLEGSLSVSDWAYSDHTIQQSRAFAVTQKSWKLMSTQKPAYTGMCMAALFITAKKLGSNHDVLH